MKLRPLQDPQRTIAGYFDSVVDAGRAVSAVAAAGLTPSALELVDRQCLLAVDAWKNMGLSVDANAVLLGRVDTADPAGEEEAQKMRACFEEAGATWSAVSTDQEEADALFAARRLAYPAMERLGPVLTEDVCVPKRRVAEMFSRIERIGVDYGITIANIAHAGDGNLHPLLITPRGDDAARVRAQAAFAEIIEAAPEFGGTVTGEHGVGVLKMDGLAKELDPVVLAMHRSVKSALDPHGILNPGKIFSEEAWVCIDSTWRPGLTLRLDARALRKRQSKHSRSRRCCLGRCLICSGTLFEEPDRMSAGQIIRRRPPSPSPSLRALTHMHMPTSIPSPMAKWGYRYSVRERGSRRATALQRLPDKR